MYLPFYYIGMKRLYDLRIIYYLFFFFLACIYFPVDKKKVRKIMIWFFFLQEDEDVKICDFPHWEKDLFTVNIYINC